LGKIVSLHFREIKLKLTTEMKKILQLLKAKFSSEWEDGLKLLASAIALQFDTEAD
jgi:hypothetical protein